MPEYDMTGEFKSPGGFVFGVQGWTWGEPRPKSITFFLDGTAKVSDQHGRPIRGTVVENKEVLFATDAPKETGDKGPTVTRSPERAKLATHAQVVDALQKEGVDWRKLAIAGWPQIPYKQLMELGELPTTPIEELQKISDRQLRRDALRARAESDEVKTKELAAADAE